MNIRTARAGIVVGIASISLLLNGLSTGAAAAGPSPAVAEVQPFAAAPAASTDPGVTLITGDRVQLVNGADGKPTISFQPASRADGRPVNYTSFGNDGHLYVIPSDVAPLVPDKLDLNLFDVLALEKSARDKTNDGTPVIVQTAAPASARVATPNWTALGVDPERTLESISAVAGEVSADDGAPALVDAVENAPTVKKVWLDAPIHVLDADSMPQIGAPAAWAAGQDGTGATVAVLDSGIDTSHPDLDDGVVTLQRDFTGSGSTNDELGHGTHVASIIAGTGEASDGANRGVAPGAHLLNGRVLNAAGEGDTSWVIDAMEWAAANGADVINLSLGEKGNYTDGSDPAAMAVDSISQRYDTLVVIAAGNEGNNGTSGTVTTPGTATTALTVGAVTDSDSIAYFSSVGPRFGDDAIKPDIVAPGDGIVAARAAGTNIGDPVDDLYTSMSGTSMATPHVAGAAAILRAARPDLSAQALKSVLMASAQPTGNPVYSEGAGRLWIPGALGQDVYPTPASLSFGVFSSPRATEQPRTQTVTYTNTSDAEYTLQLSVTATSADGTAAPTGLVSLSTDTVTVPGHGTATVDVVVDPQAADPNRFTGALTAARAGFAPVRTVLTFRTEPDMHTLRLEATQHSGAPAAPGSSGMVYGIDDPSINQWFGFTDGVAEVRLPAGRYAVMGQLLNVTSPTARFLDGFTSYTRDVTLDGDKTLVLNGRQGIPVDVRTEKESKEHNVDEGLIRTLPNRQYPVQTYVTTGIGGPEGGLDLDLYVLPADGALAGEVKVSTRYMMFQPLLDVSAVGRGRPIDVSRELNYGVLSPTYVGALSAPLVDGGTGTPAELAAAGAKGAVVLVEDHGDPTLDAQAQAAKDAGAKAVIVYGAGPGPFYESVEFQRFLFMTEKPLPTLTLSRDIGLKLIALAGKGGARLKGTGIATPSYQYALGYLEDHIPKSLTYQANSRTTARSEVEVKAFAPNTPMSEMVIMQGGGNYTGFSFDVDAPLATREVYYSTDRDITFERSIQPMTKTAWPSRFTSAPNTYRPRQLVKETMVGQVHHGGLLPAPDGPETSSVYRDGDFLAINLPYRVDGAGNAQEWGPDEGTTGRFQFWMDDQQLVDSEGANASGTLLPETHAYRMRLESHRDVDWWPLSTGVTTEWGFRSATTAEPTILPLLQLDYGVKGLDELNTGARSTRLDLRVSHQDGSAGGSIRGLKLWSSADAGATWKPVHVAAGRKAGEYSATVAAPPGATSLSLRSEAWDSAGSTFKETVIDAWAVDSSHHH
ncbi:S8 family peptidase [Nakamurella lactea]|uniref:S8 family peptidase n=1 Tax=Nakamurella lactea TaxID=459515 RepID=UPI0004201DE8|nr:S8 family serine peptidase [Nakamurella lactea]